MVQFNSNGTMEQAIQFRSNISEPIILVLEFRDFNLNITEISACLETAKMGIINDGLEPYSADYTACALRSVINPRGLCDDGRQDFYLLIAIQWMILP